jgi:hypothetical protein
LGQWAGMVWDRYGIGLGFGGSWADLRRMYTRGLGVEDRRMGHGIAPKKTIRLGRSRVRVGSNEESFRQAASWACGQVGIRFGTGSGFGGSWADLGGMYTSTEHDRLGAWAVPVLDQKDHEATSTV